MAIHPPLRIREEDGDPNLIPVFDLIVSNGTLTPVRPGVARLATGAGAGGAANVYAPTGGRYLVLAAGSNLVAEQVLVQSGDSISIVTDGSLVTINATTSDVSGLQDILTYPFIVGSGGTGLAVIGSATSLLGANSTDADQLDYYSLRGGDSIDVVRAGTLLTINATTSGAASTIFAPTGGRYVVTAAGSDLVSELLLTASDNITIVTNSTTVFISANTAAPVSSDTIFAPTGGRYVVLAAGSNLIAEQRLVQSGNSITISTDGTSVIVNAVTGDTTQFVATGTAIATTFPVEGGGDFSADRTHTVDTAFLVTSARLINTTAPVAGGGNLGADRTITVDTVALVTSGRTITAGTGLTGGGDLSADRTFSVNTDIRDKTIGFFAAGNISTAMDSEEARIYIPFNMEPRRVQITATTTPTGADMIADINLYADPEGSGTSIFTAASRPTIVATSFFGVTSDFEIQVLHAGSYLGFDMDQVGSTNAGSNMTLTLIARTS